MMMCLSVGWSSSVLKSFKNLLELGLCLVVGIKWCLTASVLGTDAMTDSPLEVGLRVGLDKGVNWADVSLGITTTAAITSASSSHVLVITTNA